MDKEATSLPPPHPPVERPLSALDSLAAAAEGAAKAESQAAAAAAAAAAATAESRNPTAWIHETPTKGQGEGATAVQNGTTAKESQAENGAQSSLSQSQNRRGPGPNGAIGSVYSGGRIKHLKKEDGTPLWRKDIQYSFLKAVFEDTKPVFTSFEDGTKNLSFAEIYIRAMAYSSKCSKVLRDKLLGDKDSALNMAMICLLVNAGRMNTTLNFFPEMRAQLRTYHAIPCLQADQDTKNSGYKGLQDAPRLKSILKGAQEDKEQPNTLDKIQAAAIPRTNPVNLIFVLSQYASKVSEIHFSPPVDFFDLITRPTLSSKSRARAFLWLLWWYLESDFSDEQAINNPYGSGMPDPSDAKSRPLKVPPFDYLSEEQADLENVDTEEEQEYGWKMKDVRKRILDSDDGFGAPGRKTGDRAGSPKVKDELGADSPIPGRGSPGSRSPSPTSTPLNIGRGRGGDSYASGRRPVGRVSVNKLKDSRLGHGSSPAPPGPGHITFPTGHANAGGSGVGRGRSRPETSHQRAVHANKQMRINKILHTKLRHDQKDIRRRNNSRLATRTGLALQRIMALPDDYDSEEEKSFGPGGLVPLVDLLGEEEDYGSEATKLRKVLHRASRRISRDRNALDGLSDNLNGATNGRRKHRIDDGDDDTASQITIEDSMSQFDSIRRSRPGRGRSALGRSPLAQRHVAAADSDRIDSDAQGDDDDIQDSDLDSLGDVDMED